MYCCEFNNSKIEEGKRCSFATFDVPVKDNCPVCGHTMFKKAGRGAKKAYCINEECSNFTPEEKRGGWRKPAAKTEGGEEVKEEKKTTKTAAKKTAAKKTTAKKTTAKKTAAKKTAAKKTTAKKPAAKKTTTKKTAAKKAEE